MTEKVKAAQAGKKRATRLAQALRDNLRKRKEQARQRNAPAEGESKPGIPPEQDATER
jgi:hypothetical protein